MNPQARNPPPRRKENRSLMPPQSPVAGASWEVRSRATKSSLSAEAFVEGETIVSRLVQSPEGLLREDYKMSEWSAERRNESLFHWKTQFRLPPPRKESPFKEEDADEKLREYMAANDPALVNTVWFLAVLLERKRRFVERGVQRDADGRKVRIYEEKEGGETFFIIDPELAIDQIADLQQEIALQLGWIKAPEEPVADSPEIPPEAPDSPSL